MGIYEELERKNLIAQVTNKEKIKDLLNNKKITFYVGFEPTASSLHVGHFVQLLIISRLQKAGHIPIILFGGGTGLIGDPSGKTDMRKILTQEEINHNISCFKKQAEKFVDFSESKAIMLNNFNWLSNLNYIDFLREIGVCFSVNRMLSAGCYKLRLEKGLSFFELNYMIIQSYDFLVLNNNYNCILELGGNDQWSNIIGGVELVRKKNNKEVFGMTFELLTNSEGVKMGKTEKGAIWLDPNKTPIYKFYQYWRNIQDTDVIKCLKTLTLLNLETINTYSKLSGKDLNKVKDILAFEITKLVHGEKEAKKARESSQHIFNGNKIEINNENLTFKINLDNNINIIDLLLKINLSNSKGEARRLVEQGGISIDDKKITDINFIFHKNEFRKDFIIRKGKKIHKKVILK
ncbi:MAG: tyrosine--tRNA ligase [Candidatus Paraimprobicoccus trichonymphae]|uniref:Tyrosine--tRNA ligase n=1 Tax=Candidatus Paraimprobicoccus trichonymphae TaxID=3033793 RepID=A0AA48L1N5_9FIRM|nr:MAG: tyrosine--tRNA ligase [Candidatus Paraimprobicoccus trichonymphae]